MEYFNVDKCIIEYVVLSQYDNDKYLLGSIKNYCKLKKELIYLIRKLI